MTRKKNKIKAFLAYKERALIRALKKAEEQKVTLKEGKIMSDLEKILALVLTVVVLVACSLLGFFGFLIGREILVSNNPQTAIKAVATIPMATSTPTGTVALCVQPTPTPTLALQTPVWDNTCKSQSALVGVTLTPQNEGKFFACTWTGLPNKVNIPPDMYADIDKGSVFVAAGPVYIPSVGRLTLRPWDSGLLTELCSHLNDLTSYGAKQNPPYTPAPWNFDCTGQ